MLQEQFEQLRFLPVNSRQMTTSDSGYSDDGEMEHMLQEIYQEHGWPNLEHYRKEDSVSLAPWFTRYTVNYISRDALSHLLTHLVCVYNRSV
jgi:hypothetical protein